MQFAWRHIFVGVGLLSLTACSPEQDITAPDTPVLKSDVSATLTSPKPPLFPKSKTVDDIDFSQYSRDLAKFTELTLGQSRIAAIDVLRLHFAPEQGAKIIKTASSNFKLDGGSVMLMSADGISDDSVRAQEFYLIFEGDPNAEKLADFGARIKCYRGENITEWQTELCP